MRCDQFLKLLLTARTQFGYLLWQGEQLGCEHQTAEFLTPLWTLL